MRDSLTTELSRQLIRGTYVHRSTVVLIAVFASVALGVGALVSFALAWSTPEQREIRRLSQLGAAASWRS